MFLEPVSLLIMVVGGGLSFLASLWVKTAFNAASQIPTQSGLTGAEVARAILRAHDLDQVTIEEHQGFLSDHYNPLTRSLALSPEVYNGRHAAAAGVAAHEVGHAIQHAQGYTPMWIRSMLVPVASLGSNLGLWLTIIGIMLGSAAQAAQGTHGLGWWLAVVGVTLFAGATAFALVTVPVEFDASARAKATLVDLGLLRSGEESDQVRSVLTAAGMTYVAGAFTAILWLLYYAWQAGLLGGGRSDDE